DAGTVERERPCRLRGLHDHPVAGLDAEGDERAGEPGDFRDELAVRDRRAVGQDEEVAPALRVRREERVVENITHCLQLPCAAWRATASAASRGPRATP